MRRSVEGAFMKDVACRQGPAQRGLQVHGVGADGGVAKLSRLPPLRLGMKLP